jgi:hypothetical protein
MENFPSALLFLQTKETILHFLVVGAIHESPVSVVGDS